MKLREVISRLVRHHHAIAQSAPRAAHATARALLESRACTRLHWLLEARFGDNAQLLIDSGRTAADPVLRVIVRVTGNIPAQQHLTILYIIRHVMEYYGLLIQASVQAVDAESRARADRVH